DQRNWTDASYKTYCTPLGIPFPVVIEAGDRIHQKIDLDITGTEPGSIIRDGVHELVFTIDEDLGFSLPGLGTGTSSSYNRLDRETCDLIRKSGLDHIRWDIDMTAEDLPDKLQAVRQDITRMDTAACLALFFGDDPVDEFERFMQEASVLKDRIKYMILFTKAGKTTPTSLINELSGRIRENLPGIRIGGGTNAYFAELNRERVDQKDLDFIVYSVNPQVHAFDHASLTETLEAQFYTVKSARLFFPGKEIMISPVTLKPRFNPNATGSELPSRPGELPPQVDVRQMSLFGACWTLASIKYLSEAGINWISYYETAGWRGLVQGPDDPPESRIFKTGQGDVFPVYLVFRWLSEIREATLIRTFSSNPLIFDGLAVRHDSAIHVFLANFSLRDQKIDIPGSKSPCHQRILSIKNVREFMKDPEGKNIITRSEVADVRLPPCSINWISFQS
ncbi:MAG: hypothetical protein KFF73_13390, partial [Cyclobacteriaceae bacterium]|nr:hypothetical protein [Cyclobacteriaceae bacterium]